MSILFDTMRQANNFFFRTQESGQYTLKDGNLQPVANSYIKGQYIIIAGSVLNDGAFRVEKVDNGVLFLIPDDKEYPPWVKPTGGHDTYKAGDKRSHYFLRYISKINGNATEPGTDERYWAEVQGGEIQNPTFDEEIASANIFSLAIPPDFLALVETISDFRHSQDGSNIVSESVAGLYNYTKATGKDGVPLGWQQVFSSQISAYRKSMFLPDLFIGL